MTIDLKAQSKRVRIQHKAKNHNEERDELFPFIQSNHDKQFSPWNIEEYSRQSYRPHSKSMNCREKEAKLLNRLVEPQAKFNSELIEIIRREKHRHKRPIQLKNTIANTTKLNQISLQLDEELLYSPEKVYGLPEYCQENRSASRYQSRGSQRGQPMRVKIFKRMSQKRQRENQTREMRDNQYFKDNKLTKIKKKPENQLQKPYRTISLQLGSQVKPKLNKQKQYFHLTVRKLKAKQINFINTKNTNSNNKQKYNQHKQFSLLQCKGQICFNLDKHQIRKHKLKQYAIDNTKQHGQAVFLQ